MSIRNLDRLFRPESVALIGASNQPASVGRTLFDNLLDGGFSGPIMPVNPRHDAIGGVIAYPDVASLPQTPDLAVIATPAAAVPGLIAELGDRGTRAAIVVTAGFGDHASTEGAALQQAMLDAARPHLLRVVGPNCVGVLVPRLGLNASFAHRNAVDGDIAFVAQSGAMVTSVLDWAGSRGIGFSHLVSLGDMADVDFGDMLDFLAGDPKTRAILLYVEALTHARKFMSAARMAARLKPVIVVKAGRSAAGARAAASHTGALAGEDAVYDAAFRRAGMLRVPNLESLFAAVATLSGARRPRGDRLAIVSNGGGVGVLATDALIEAGGRLAELSPETVRRLDAVLPATWSRANPIDIIGDAPPERYARALDIVLEDVPCDGVLVMNCPTAIASGADAARAVVDIAGGASGRRHSILTCWLGEDAARPARDLFAAHRIPTYDTPDDAVAAFMQLACYRRNQDLLMETPPARAAAFAPDRAAAAAVIAEAVSAGREWLNEIEAKRVLNAYGIATVATAFADGPAAVAREAAALGVPVAVKVVSPQITHKTDVGGVALDLRSAEAAAAAAEAMAARIADVLPEARIEGYAVQPMAARPRAFELIVGLADDPLFGPVVVFGQGGTGVEIIDDKAIALPPLNLKLAREVIARTRVYKLLKGYRGRPPADLEGVELALMKVAQIAADHDHVAALDINPLLADEFGVTALDARIRLAVPARPGHARFAIRPYPGALDRRLRLAGGERIRLRPIRPEDEPVLQAAFGRLSPHDVRMRFFAPLKSLNHDMAARLTQIDYDREMAFVAVRDDPAGAGEGERQGEGLGVARLYADPDNEAAEFAVTVLTDFQGHGLGHLLMEALIDYARDRGIGRLFGKVLGENRAMLKLCRGMGFSTKPAAGEPGVVDVVRDLANGSQAADQPASMSSA
jgi:acetyltransferase